MLLLHAAGFAEFKGYCGYAGPEGGTAQIAAYITAVQYCGCAEMPGEFQHRGIIQIGAQLRQVGSVQRTGMQVHQEIAMPDDFLEEGVGDAGGGTAFGVAREIAV